MFIKNSEGVYSLYSEELDPINDYIEIVITKTPDGFEVSDYGYFYDEFIKFLPDKNKLIKIKDKYKNIKFVNEKFFINSNKDDVFENIILIEEFLKDLSASIKKTRRRKWKKQLKILQQRKC